MTCTYCFLPIEITFEHIPKCCITQKALNLFNVVGVLIDVFLVVLGVLIDVVLDVILGVLIDVVLDVVLGVLINVELGTLLRLID